MKYTDEIDNDDIILKAKSNIIDNMLLNLLDGKSYEDLDIDERLKMHKLIRERFKLKNKCCT